MHVKRAVKGVSVRQQVQSHSLFRKSESISGIVLCNKVNIHQEKYGNDLKSMIVDDDDNSNRELTSAAQYGRRPLRLSVFLLTRAQSITELD